MSDEFIPKDEYVRRSRRSFLAFGALGAAGYFGFHRLQNRPTDDAIPDVIRNGLEWNERVWEGIQRDGADSRTFAITDREDIRVNGRIGLGDELAADALAGWQIELTSSNGTAMAPVGLDEIKALPVQDLVWEHKCIEGWSNVVHWTGVRFTDFVTAFAPEESDWEYSALRTPGGGYYVGVDRFTMLHDQTLLAWQLNGEDLTQDHGAPIRLVTPLKYGIKQLKRVASIEFTGSKPPDYWAERGYDYHSGF